MVTGRVIEDAVVYVAMSAHTAPVPISVQGAGWRCVVKTADVVATWPDQVLATSTITLETLSHMCWDVSATHRAPIRTTPSIISAILSRVGAPLPTLSYRQARVNIIQEQVWRDLEFICTLRP